MRTVLVTGLGGAGRTTVAAASALAEAARGSRTLFLSTGPGQVYGTPLPAAPPAATGISGTTGATEVAGTTGATEVAGTTGATEVAEGLWAARIDTGAGFRAEFLSLQERGATALELLGAARLAEEELTELPGSDHFALLRALTTAGAGEWDTVVIDLPPVLETISLLALPAQLRRYLRRLLPPERQAARALRPVLAQLAGVPMPAQWLYETTARWDSELAAVQRLIEAPGTTLRLVAEPGPAAADALRTARTGLALHGLRVDTLVANRVLPRHSADTWLSALAAQQEKTLHEWYEEWTPGTALRELPHTGRDPRGLDDLTALGIEAGPPPADVPWTVEDRREEDGTFVWLVPLPGATKGDIGLVRRGDELVLTVGPFRRIVPLPSALRRCTVSGAALTDGVLRVRFTPDPGLWPRTP
ncbi:ArsA family ATPase [Streptomyces sp. NPDC055078]